MAQVAEYKKQKVDSFVELIKAYPIIGVVNMENMPAPQLQTMRAKLRGTAELAMAKRRLMKIALEIAKQERKGIEQLQDKLEGMPALIFTKENPFKLANMLRKYKSKAPAKPGQIAPSDILIKATVTPFAPGPIIAELGNLGLKTGVQGGKVAIKQDKIVVRAGEAINAKTAEILARLGITPMEIGLDLVAVYDEGIIYSKDVLSVDEKEYINALKKAVSDALWFSIGIGFPTKSNIKLLIARAHSHVKALAERLGTISGGADFTEFKGTEEKQTPEESEALAEQSQEQIEDEESQEQGEAEEIPSEEEAAEQSREQEEAKEIPSEDKEAELKAEEPEKKIESKTKAMTDAEKIAERAKAEKEAEEKRLQLEDIKKLSENLKKKGTLRGLGTDK